MVIILCKVLLTPLLICVVTFVTRRWGHAVGGWLVALPLTAGPVVLFDSIENSPEFGVRAATGCLAGTVALIGFSLVYAAIAERARWFSALAVGLVAYSAIGTAMTHVPLSGVLLFALILCALPLALRLVPAYSIPPSDSVPSCWDLPFRMLTATAIVLALTGGARVLGPAVSGLLASLPVYAGTLTAFAHHAHGGRAGVAMIKGLLFGLFGYACFFLTLVLLLPRCALALVFLVACAVNLAVQGCSLYILTRQHVQ